MKKRLLDLSIRLSASSKSEKRTSPGTKERSEEWLREWRPPGSLSSYVSNGQLCVSCLHVHVDDPNPAGDSLVVDSTESKQPAGTGFLFDSQTDSRHLDHRPMRWHLLFQIAVTDSCC
jgi:hypothetical protein